MRERSGIWCHNIAQRDLPVRTRLYVSSSFGTIYSFLPAVLCPHLPSCIVHLFPTVLAIRIHQFVPPMNSLAEDAPSGHANLSDVSLRVGGETSARFAAEPEEVLGFVGNDGMFAHLELYVRAGVLGDDYSDSFTRITRVLELPQDGADESGVKLFVFVCG